MNRRWGIGKEARKKAIQSKATIKKEKIEIRESTEGNASYSLFFNKVIDSTSTKLRYITSALGGGKEEVILSQLFDYAQMR